MAFPEAAARMLLPGGAAAVARAVAVGGSSSFGLWEVVKAKAAELVVFLAGLLSAVAEMAETLLFSPEERPSDPETTNRRWIHVAVMVVLPAVLVALALHCCCCAGGRRRRRMMVAPGRGGARMPRGVFEDDPRSYFRALRDRQPLVF